LEETFRAYSAYRASRQGTLEFHSIALGHNTVVEDHEYSAICTRPNKATKTLSEPLNSLRNTVLAKSVLELLTASGNDGI
jgi:hypothetical protein